MKKKLVVGLLFVSMFVLPLAAFGDDKEETCTMCCCGMKYTPTEGKTDDERKREMIEKACLKSGDKTCAQMCQDWLDENTPDDEPDGR